MRGIAAARLRPVGYGPYCPVDEQHNEQAWEKNAAWSFKVMATQDGPTGVKLGCELAVQKGIELPKP